MSIEKSTPRSAPVALGIMRSRIPLNAAFADVFLGITRRPTRAALTMAGTVVGVTALVATLALSTTVAHQVSSAFDEFSATEVVVRDAQPTADEPAFPMDVMSALTQVPGIRSGGLLWNVADTPVSALPMTTSEDAEHLPLIAADPGAVLALRPTLSSGRVYNEDVLNWAPNVAILGTAAAETLGVAAADGRTAVFVNGHPLTVIGVISATGRRPETLLSIIVPRQTAARLGMSGTSELILDTRPGAAAGVAKQAPVALSPYDPSRLTALAPPDPRTLRQSIEGRLRTLLFGLAAISLVVGAVGIANATLVSVMERTGEFGLRRALGATPRHVIGAVVGEAAALGGLGGLVGASLGLLTVVVIAYLRRWQVVADGWLLVVGPALGAFTGAIAGTAPALRARRIQPVEALRR